VPQVADRDRGRNALFVTPRGDYRAIWRLLFFFAVAFSSTYVLSAAARFTLVTAGMTPSGFWAQFMFALILPLGLLAAHAASLLLLDQHGWALVGLDAGALNRSALSVGVTLSVVAVGVPTLVLLAAHQFAMEPAPDASWWGATVRTSALLLPAALWEELVFRGYPFAVLRRAIGWKGALMGTSVVFGLAHMQNGGANLQNIVIVITAGFFLGMILLATRSLYAAWAAHFAWNWVMACAFHVNVSGNPFERPDYQMVPLGPAWLTGGGWGPEGGIGAAIGLFAVVFYVYGRYLKRLES
jgi:membrane protease YdiL (CAAX protease family)